ncbi:hypothetical protein HNQ60_000486 [Povalibacter uvarum]|uniref:Ice-binding protein C-terminal domain-containing protein n=1 Tax=Povalibacter uvarum TaxID=732238 RepID=A0A841HH34_9GAMM|nr:PEP-CTERM sorting domain-containing protein [Povalibacter uvarum]MBB6091640.1 hypothetical protein [Povalibacter uvarum]
MLRSGLLVALVGFASFSEAAIVRFDVQFGVNTSPGAPTNWTGSGAVPTTITGSWFMDSEAFDAANYTMGQLTPTSAQTLTRYSVDGIGVSGVTFLADGAPLWSGNLADGLLRGDQTSTFYDAALGVVDGGRSFSLGHARSGPAFDAAAFQALTDPVSALLLSFTSLNVGLLTGEWGRLALSQVSFTASSVPEPGTLALLGLGVAGIMLGRSRRKARE